MQFGGFKSLSGVRMIFCTKVKSVGRILQIELWSPRITVSAYHHHKARTGPEQQTVVQSQLDNFIMEGTRKDTRGTTPSLQGTESLVCSLPP